MIIISIIELEITRLFFNYMFDKNFLQMFVSGLFYSGIVALIFVWWLNKYKLKTDRNKVQNFLKKELENFYKRFEKMLDGEYLISMNIYCWEHIDQRIIFDVFYEGELKKYFKLYNHLADMQKYILKLNELDHSGYSVLPPKEKNLKIFYLSEFDRNKKEFIDYYKNFFEK